MKVFLWWTLLLSLAAPTLAEPRPDEAGVNGPYLLPPQQRRQLVGGQPRPVTLTPTRPRLQPGSGLSASLKGIETHYHKKETTDFTPRQGPAERQTLSDWELVQLWFQPEAVFPTHWKTHRGAAEEAVVLLRVRGDEGVQTYTGLVVRCDGFLMAPQAVWDAVRDRKKVEVVVTQAEGETEVGPFPILHRNPHRSRRGDYHFVKLNDHHLRSLPLLGSWNLKEGTPLRVVWAEPKLEGKGLVARSVEATCKSVSTEFRGTEATLTFAGGTPAGLPSGAVVLDAASGAALGMIPDRSKPTVFASTRLFNDLSSEVALAPDRDAVQGKKPQDPNMVKVPGGPVVYDEKDFVRSYQTTIACTGDFWCDRYLVTMKEWREYLDVRRDRPLPQGWDSRNRAVHPTMFPKYPVMGPTAGDMKDFATLHNKRLITTVEWILAAKMTGTDWLDRLEADVQGIQTAIGRAQNQLEKTIFNEAKAAERVVTVSRQGAKGRAETITRDTTPTSEYDQIASQAIGGYVEQLQDLRQRNAATVARMPGQPQEVGSYADDKSDYGVFDVTMNVPEACLGWGGNYAIAPKLRPAGQDPFVSDLFYAGRPIMTNRGDTIMGIYGTIAGAGLDDPIVWAAVWATQFGGKQRLQPMGSGVNGRELATARQGQLPDLRMIQTYVLDISAEMGLGFRCAR